MWYLSGRKLIKVAVFGGSFDPIHNGHLAVIRQVLTRFSPDLLLIVPNFQSPHKGRPASSIYHREAMLRLALSEFDEVAVSTYELDQYRPVFTIETLTHLSMLYPNAEITFVMGLDTFLGFQTWREYQIILKNYSLLVVTREVVDGESDWVRFNTVKSELGFLGENIQALKMPPVAISSTQVRAAIESGKTLSEWVPENVCEYIYRHSVYSSSHFVLGVTGPAGVGKTYAQTLLENRFHFQVIDLDVVGHRCLEDPVVIQDLVALFGPDIAPAGIVERPKLREKVLGSSENIRALNSIVHPRIKELVLSELTDQNGPVLIVGALLKEIGLSNVCHAVLLIESPKSLVQARIGARIDFWRYQQSYDQFKSWCSHHVLNQFDSQFELDLIAFVETELPTCLSSKK